MVWYLDVNKAKCNQITAITISVEGNNLPDDVWIRYTIDKTNYSEKELFSSKEDLIASL